LHRFRRPRGLLALAEVDGMPAGVGAVRALDPGLVEIKRMYVRPEYRGAHLGSRMLEWLLDGSRDHFLAQIIRLDSNRFMGGAHRLYESRGFVERPPYDETDIPPDLRHLWRFYERSLP
jgi:GNAT superfamily N-acetyltransferase